MRRVGFAGLALMSLVGAGALIAGSADQTKEFEITVKRFSFSPDRIEVNQGDTVRLNIKSSDSKHGFEIKPYKIKKAIPKGGQPITIEFVATQPGTFEISCSEYCGKGHEEMKATLVVTPAAAH
jgi:cytochrome c oxidase subunit 2